MSSSKAEKKDERKSNDERTSPKNLKMMPLLRVVSVSVNYLSLFCQKMCFRPPPPIRTNFLSKRWPSNKSLILICKVSHAVRVAWCAHTIHHKQRIASRRIGGSGATRTKVPSLSCSLHIASLYLSVCDYVIMRCVVVWWDMVTWGPNVLHDKSFSNQPTPSLLLSGPDPVEKG